MLWSLLAQVVLTLIALVLLQRQTERHKDLQMLLLRRPLDLVTRQLHTPPPISHNDKFMLALLAFKLKRATQWTARPLTDGIRLFQPETVLKGHPGLVRRKSTYRRPPGGRPSTGKEIEHLVIQLARQNAWGYRKLEGE